MTRSRENLATGVRWGVLYAAIYGGLALLAYAVRGPEAFTSYANTGIVQILLLYLGAGLVGGAAVGLLLPLGETLLGSIFLGWLGAAPFFLGGAMIMMSPGERTLRRVVFVTLVGMLVPGSLCGAGLWWRIGAGARRRRPGGWG